MTIDEKLIFPPSGGFVTRDVRSDDIKKWVSSVLELTKRTEAGKWNEKYGIMVFKANYGYHSVMKKIVKDYLKQAKTEDSEIIVMEDVDDNKVRTWVVGNSTNIKQMIDDEFKSGQTK